MVYLKNQRNTWQLKLLYNCKYEEKDSIGKDTVDKMLLHAILVTIDHQTLNDNSITLRDRDSMEQKEFKLKI